MIFYHVTPAENLSAITQDGLKPMIGPRSAEIDEAREAVYLFETKEALEDALMGWAETAFCPDDPLVCLTIDASDLTLEQDPDVGFELLCYSNIPARNIKLLSMDIWEEHGIPDASDAKPILENDAPEISP